MSDLQVDHQADTLARQLHNAAEALGDLEPTNTEAGRVILAAARPPRASGATAAGMFAKVTNAGASLASSAPYWTFVHWGAPRRHIRANPWLLAATRATSAEVARLYVDHAQESLADNL